MRRTQASLAVISLVLGTGWASVAVAQDGLLAVAPDRLEHKALVAQVVAAREEAGGRTFSVELRRRLVGMLSGASTDRLRDFLGAGGGGSLYDLVPNALGDTAADLVYTPLTPCRIIDTRLSAGGILTPGAKQAFYVAGSTGFAGQGGNGSGCGVPDGATAVAVNFGATESVGPGNLRAYAWAGSATAPNAAVLNYGNLAPYGLITMPNGSIVPLCDPATTTCTRDIYLETFNNATHVVADVVGYFSAAVHDVQGMVLGYAYVSAAGTLGNSWMATGGTPTVGHPSTGTYTIAWPGENVYFNDTPVFITPQSGNISVSFDSFGGGAQTGVFLKNPATGAAVDNAFWVMILQDHNP